MKENEGEGDRGKKKMATIGPRAQVSKGRWKEV